MSNPAVPDVAAPHYPTVIALGLLAALVFAMSTSLKHVSAGNVPDAQNLQARDVGRFIRASIAHRLWLAGIGCDVVGLALQISALHQGALSVVQPLLLTSLLFALFIRERFEHRRVARRQWIWAFTLTVSLGGFLLLAATPTVGVTDSADHVPAAVAAGVGLALVLVCVGVVRLRPAGRWSAAILGTALGAVYAATAALIKAATDVAASEGFAVLVSWQLCAVVAVGAFGLVLSQLTFQAGPLTASLPATATLDPLFSIGIGVFVFDEQLRHGVGTDFLLILLLGVLGTAVVGLTRSRPDDLGGNG